MKVWQIAEKAVADLLPESEMFRTGVDIKWNEYRIEVRSSQMSYSETSYRFRTSPLYEAHVLICVGIENGKPKHYWVVPATKTKGADIYLSIGDKYYSTAKDLQESINQIKPVFKRDNKLFLTTQVTKRQWEWLHSQSGKLRKSKAKIVRKLISEAMKKEGDK